MPCPLGRGRCFADYVVLGSNEALRRGFEASIVPLELRDPTWDPMDVDESESEDEVFADRMDLD